MKPLVVKKKDRVKGLYVYCQKCKQPINTNICRDTDKRLSSCKFIEFHTFRASVVVPNTGGKKRKKKILKTRDLQEAIRLKFEFENELKKVGYQTIPVSETKQEDKKPIYLIECMSMYVGFLNNEGVEIHKQKERSPEHIKDVERFFKFFCLCLKENKLDHTIFRLDQVNDTIVGMLHNYILDILHYENKTYNKLMAQYRQFLAWLVNEKEYILKNPFIGVVKRKERIDNTVINQKELTALLDAVKPENSIKTFSTGKRRFFYRDWIKTAFLIALETGLRREEFITLKFSDINVDDDGVPVFIKVENFKVNRILGYDDQDEKEIKVIPVTTNMQTILQELQYSEKKGSDEYLIASGEESNRATLMDFVSKAFTHFWKLTGIEKQAQLKHLRKTYLTALVAHFGDKANIISNHANMDVLKKHYVNDEVLMQGAKGFSVFDQKVTSL